MPRTKRPLSEVDPNAANPPPSKSSKRSKEQPPKKIFQQDIFAAVDDVEAPRDPGICPKTLRASSDRKLIPEDFRATNMRLSTDYYAKDTNKLRAFCRDRSLNPSLSRDEMVDLLEKTPIDYESLQSVEPEAILKRRHIPYYGPRALKIARIRHDDEGHLDKTDYHGARIDVRRALTGEMLKQVLAKQEAVINQNCHRLETKDLITLLRERGLHEKVSREAKIDALREADKKSKAFESKEIAQEVKKWETEVEDRSKEYEENTGHPYHGSYFKQERTSWKDWAATLPETKPPQPIYDYAWQDSRWASKSERELAEICRRRDMPGAGTKAARIKWLETGKLMYEDLYAFSLDSLCRKRNLPHGGVKKQLMQRLENADLELPEARPAWLG